MNRRLLKHLQSRILLYQNRIREYEWKLRKLSPANMLNSKRKQVADAEIRIQELLQHKLREKRHQLMILSERLHGLSPLNKLSGGYAYLSDNTGRPVSSVSNVKEKDRLAVYLKDGNLTVQVLEKQEEMRF